MQSWYAAISRALTAIEPGASSVDTVSSVGHLHVLSVLNTPQAERRRTYCPGEGPDPFLDDRCLELQNVDQELIELSPWPLNPLARRPSFWAGIDPVRALRILLTRRRVDAVICTAESCALILLGLRGLFRFRPSIILWDVPNTGWRVRDLVLRFVMPRADLVLALTMAHKRYMETKFRLKRPPVVVGYRIDEHFFSTDAEPCGSECGQGGYVLAVGKDGGRDYPTLLEAMRDIDVPLVIRSDLPVDVPLPMRSRVTILSRRISYRDLRALYKGASLVALPLVETENPGGITALFEAAAMAKPVVCSDTGGTRDFVRDGENGLLVRPSDAGAMRSAISSVLAGPERASKMGIQARRDLERDFSSARWGERRAQAVRALLDQKFRSCGRSRA